MHGCPRGKARWTSRTLIAALWLSALCCSDGRDRDDGGGDGQLTSQLRDAPSAGTALRELREEVLDKRRGPAWLAKLPQRMQKGDRGNRPFSVQDARVSGSSNQKVSPKARGHASALMVAPEAAGPLATTVARASRTRRTQMKTPAPPAPDRSDRPRPDDRRMSGNAYEMRRREAWNAMLENARVGLLAQGKLLVEPVLRDSAVSSIMVAAQQGDVQLIQAALDADGASIGIINAVGETPLMLAAISGSSDALALLLARGAELNTRDVHGWTALMKAVAVGHDTAVKLLLAAGADAHVVNLKNQTACYIAGAWGRNACRVLLVDAASCPSVGPEASVHPDDQGGPGRLALQLGVAGGEGPTAAEQGPAMQEAGAPDAQALCTRCVAPLRASDVQGGTPARQMPRAGRAAASEGEKEWKTVADLKLSHQREKEQEAFYWIGECVCFQRLAIRDRSGRCARHGQQGWCACVWLRARV